MSVEWRTPKTNWTSEDYFNLEDIVRISDNVSYLYNKLGVAYPHFNSSVYFYFWYKNYGSVSYYGKLSPSYQIYGGDYWEENYSQIYRIGYIFFMNIWSLWEIYLAALYGVTYKSSVALDYYNVDASPEYFDTDVYGVFTNYPAIYETNNPLDYYWFTGLRKVFEIKQQPYYSYKREYARDNSVDRILLSNKPFFSASELNIIETVENETNIRLDNVIGD